MTKVRKRNLFTANYKKLFHVWEVSALFFILVFMSGCNLFGHDHRSQESEFDEEPVSQAPLALFDISVQSGKAPLTVDFSDTSTNGSSTITSWSWDFGDGGSSAEQNPQYTYVTEGDFNVSLSVTTSVASDNSAQSTTVSVSSADTITKITLVDSRGLPVTDVTVSSDVFSVEGQNVNQMNQLLVSMRPNESQGVVRLHKEGFTDGLLFLDNTLFNSTQSVTLLDKRPPIIFDATRGGEYIGIDGASVNLSDNALVKADGSMVTGNVELYIVPVDISDPIKKQAFPGSFYGLPAEADLPEGASLQQPIISYGVVSYTFYQDGEELQLADGEVADLQLPLYTNQSIYGEDIQIGELIPVWTLNESTGIWLQEGVGTVIANPAAESGLSLSAQTSHFSSFNVDAWAGFPGGIGGPGAGAGAGGGRGFCEFTIDFIGAIPDLPIHFSYTLLLNPSWNFTRTIEDNFLNGSAPEGTGVRVNAWQYQEDEMVKSGTVTFGCGAARQGPISLTFGDSEPEFREWEVSIKPLFERASPQDDYVIAKNNVRIGGRFVGTDRVDIESDLLTADILSLPNLQMMDLEFDRLLHGSPTTIVSTLTNEVGTTVDTAVLEVIESHSPIIDHFYANTGNNTIVFSWDVDGADEATVYYLDNDPGAAGLLMFRIDDVEQGAIENSQLINSTGFIRIEFNNVYGSSVIIARLAELECIVGSELPGCFPT